MEDEKWKKKLNEAILKVAKGCSVAEVVEEYVEVDGEMKLTKQKKTKKEIPPDLKALQLLLGDEKTERPIAELSDEELQAEKTRLLHLLAEREKKEKAALTEKKPRPKPRKRVVRIKKEDKV